jgi:hypothetical protein
MDKRQSEPSITQPTASKVNCTIPPLAPESLETNSLHEALLHFKCTSLSLYRVRIAQSAKSLTMDKLTAKGRGCCMVSTMYPYSH